IETWVFNGTWKIHSLENHQEFLKAMAVPEMLVKMLEGVKPTTTNEQKGDDFTIKKKGVRNHCNGWGALLTSADVTKCYTDTQPKTPNSKQCRCRSTVARKNSLERQEPRQELSVLINKRNIIQTKKPQTTHRHDTETMTPREGTKGSDIQGR
uniref:Lipocalin/cytosolic fatty-acid binding domain-containing protein n=1 Tax=Hucho hucho TaxID=62062 RepID=A0A4W5LC80_9TELE